MRQNDFNQILAFTSGTTQNSEAYQLEEGVGVVDAIVNVSAIAGVGASLAIKAQTSHDKVTWEDRVVLNAVTATGSKKLRVVEPMTYVRFAITLSGTTPTATVSIYMQGREGGEGGESGLATPTGTQTLIGKNSGGDFTIAYASATTLTIGALPDASALTVDDITSLVHMNGQGSVIAEYSRDDAPMSISGGVLTVTGAKFESGDLFVIYTNVARNSTNTSDTELPAAAALADATANPTTPTVGAANLGFNGTTWDRLRAGITAVTSTLTGWLNTLPWAIYNSTPSTRTNGQGGPLEADVSGNLRNAEQYMPQAEDNTVGCYKVEQRFDGAYISTATTTTVKSGSGFLHGITVNGGTAGTIIIYDNTAASGTIIASFDSTNALATYMFNRRFTTGLTIVTSAATKVSVSYR